MASRKSVFLLLSLIICLFAISRYRHFEINRGWPIEVERMQDRYQIKLKYELLESRKSPPKFTIAENLVKINGSKSINLTFDQLVNIPYNQWRNAPIHPYVQLLYPQDIDVAQTIYNLTRGKPISEVSKPYPLSLILSDSIYAACIFIGTN